MAQPLPELVEVRGSTVPRVFTPPLVTGPPGDCGCGCALSPATSYGFAVEVFAEVVLGQPLDPWQRWAAIHMGELLPNGRPRFRKLLILVARQNGKTELLVVLSLFMLYVEQAAMVLGTSTQIKYARESWLKVVRKIKKVPALAALLPDNRNQGIRRANGEQEVCVLREPGGDEEDACRYVISAANEEGGRSLSIDFAILDELRQHFDYSAWDAIIPAMNARPRAQAVAITNMGDDRSLVLNDLIEQAEAYIESGDGDDRLGMFAWTAPPNADPLDLTALAWANPNLGYVRPGREDEGPAVDPDALLAEARGAVRVGGKKLAGYRTEIMCQRVKNLDPAIDPDAWLDCLELGDLSEVRSRVALCIDVSLDAQHATLVAAAVLPDGRVRVEPVEAWSGPGCTVELVRSLPDHVARVKPRALGWLANGPAAAVSVDLKKRRGWPPRGVKLLPIKADAADVCMGFAAAVDGKTVVHSADPLLDAHVAVAEPIRTAGDRWTFGRRGSGHVDALYAAAGARHLALSLPRTVAASRVIVAGGTPT